MQFLEPYLPLESEAKLGNQTEVILNAGVLIGTNTHPHLQTLTDAQVKHHTSVSIGSGVLRTTVPEGPRLGCLGQARDMIQEPLTGAVPPTQEPHEH